ncbi:unnamed protein product, partial [Polarella glacialis]
VMMPQPGGEGSWAPASSQGSTWHQSGFQARGGMNGPAPREQYEEQHLERMLIGHLKLDTFQPLEYGTRDDMFDEDGLNVDYQ